MINFIKDLINFIRNLFKKSDSGLIPTIDSNSSVKFVLKIGDLEIGYLTVEDELWTFIYSDKFKEQDRYGRLVGFSDLNKTYKNEELWPFFKIRIPGLKQPKVQEILKKENIDKNDEVSLLSRFGRKITSNPYILEPAF